MTAAVLALATTTAETARAGSPQDASADAAFEEGRALLAQQKLVEACAKLEESDHLRRSGRAVLNLADCYERRGMIASAHARFLDAAQRALEARRPDAEQHARDRAARLEARLPRVVVLVTPSDDAGDLEILRQGRPLPRAEWNVPVTADPGTVQTFEARSRGKTFRTTVTAEEGKTARVELRWSEDAKEAPRASAARVEAGATASGASAAPRSKSMVPAYVSFGVGAAGIATGVFAGLQVLSAKSAVDAHCGADRTCDAEGASAADRGRTYAVLAPIALGIGAVGVGLGTYFVLRRGGHADDRRASFVLTPTASHTGGGFLAQGEF